MIKSIDEEITKSSSKVKSKKTSKQQTALIENYFNENIKPNLFAVSKVFAEAKKQMNLAEYKAFTLALSSIKWKEKCPDTIYLDKKQLADIVGVHSDVDHLSVDLNRAIGDMPNHSFLRFADRHKDIYVNGNFVRTIAMFKNVVRIRLEEEFLGLFGNLETNYITMWSEDIFNMSSERSVKFYELLRDNTDTRNDVNIAELGVKALKELFDIPKDGKGSYMSNGHFQRTLFERRIIEPLCEDLKKSKMLHLLVEPDGKAYEKMKKNGRVIGYRFRWTISMRPKVATAKEVKEIKERIDKNPTVLKVAKDIVKGEKKPKKTAKKDSFRNFEEREYTAEQYAELEKRLRKN